MLLFQVGEIAYLTQGVGEINIQAVIINKINRKTATVETFVGGREFEVSVFSLIRDRDLIQEVFDYINNNIKDMKKRELSKAIKNNDSDNTKIVCEMTLHYAAIHYLPEVIKVLLKNGADVNERDENGETALDIAKKYNYQEIIDLLENYNNENK